MIQNIGTDIPNFLILVYFGDGLEIKPKTLTKDLETKFKTLQKGLKTDSKTLQKDIKSNNEQQKIPGTGVHCNLCATNS
jgi:hypothetical protein